MGFFLSLHEIVHRLHAIGTEWLWLRWIRPILTHFRATARTRRGQQPDVRKWLTCKGLHGPHAERVRTVVLDTTRLMLINELKRHNYSPAAQIFISLGHLMFSTYLNQCPFSML